MLKSRIMHKFISFLRQWTLPVSMTAGALTYFLLRALPLSQEAHDALLSLSSLVMQALIFAMLALTFLKVDLRDLRFRSWQLWGLLLQCSLWVLTILLMLCVDADSQWLTHLLAAFALCMITPTATAAAVVTFKLGGNPGTLTFYTVMINLAASFFISLLVPLLWSGQSFAASFWMILCRVFPLLFGPFLLAQLIRHTSPRLQRLLTSVPDMAFYLWTVALALAICVTVRNIVLSGATWMTLSVMALGSLLSCILQFGVGRLLGRKWGDVIAASQALGQKNTAFAIWVGATFMDPVTSVAGGFYAIWHNVWNSVQLRRRIKSSKN